MSGIDVRPDPAPGGAPVRFRVEVTGRPAGLQGTLTIDGATGRVATIEGIAVTDGENEIIWEARDPEGRPLFPGPYRARLTVEDRSGQRARAASHAFRIERRAEAKVFRRVSRAEGAVALTFDDCYDRAAWDDILETLRAREATATFFCGAQAVRGAPDLARRTVTDGHTVGSHGYDHSVLDGRDPEDIAERLAADSAAWWRVAGGWPVPYLRPPYGRYDATVLTAAGNAGYPRVVLWDVDPEDWRGGESIEIVERVVKASREGSIILLHTLPATAAALADILDALASRELEPVSIPALFRLGGLRA